jgi:Holliday junction resolvase RusA-like endonuclease
MEPIRLVIPGEPKAQKRHRSTAINGYIRNYDPSQSNKKDFLWTVMNNAPAKPIDFPIRMELFFFFSRPKNHYGTGKNASILKSSAPRYHTSKPDIDNCVKFCTDSLNKVYYRDDSLISEVYTVKIYSERPRIEIVISQADDSN